MYDILYIFIHYILYIYTWYTIYIYMIYYIYMICILGLYTIYKPNMKNMLIMFILMELLSHGAFVAMNSGCALHITRTSPEMMSV
jgi:hypothetical protein